VIALTRCLQDKPSSYRGEVANILEDLIEMFSKAQGFNALCQETGVA